MYPVLSGFGPGGLGKDLGVVLLGLHRDAAVRLLPGGGAAEPVLPGHKGVVRPFGQGAQPQLPCQPGQRLLRCGIAGKKAVHPLGGLQACQRLIIAVHEPLQKRGLLRGEGAFFQVGFHPAAAHRRGRLRRSLHSLLGESRGGSGGKVLGASGRQDAEGEGRPPCDLFEHICF